MKVLAMVKLRNIRFLRITLFILKQAIERHNKKFHKQFLDKKEKFSRKF